MMLVGPHDVTAQPRLDNAELMLRTMRPPAIGDADTVLRILKAASGESCLAQCKAGLAGPSAAERIFGLMAAGSSRSIFPSPSAPRAVCVCDPRVAVRWIGPRGEAPVTESTPPRRATGLEFSKVGWGGSQVGHASSFGQPSVPGVGERTNGG